MRRNFKRSNPSSPHLRRSLISSLWLQTTNFHSPGPDTNRAGEVAARPIAVRHVGWRSAAFRVMSQVDWPRLRQIRRHSRDLWVPTYTAGVCFCRRFRPPQCPFIFNVVFGLCFTLVRPALTRFSLRGQAIPPRPVVEASERWTDPFVLSDWPTPPRDLRVAS